MSTPKASTSRAPSAFADWRRALQYTIEPWLGSSVLRLPTPLRRALAGTPRPAHGLTLDEDVHFVLRVQRLRRMPALSARRLRRDYELMPRVFGGEPLALAEVRDLEVAGRPARLYRARPGASGATLYFHGGGFVVGSLDTHDGLCRALARGSGSVVVAIDYRLAPEHPFPAAVDDCYAALVWLAAHAGELGIDARRIAVAGDSAGANLATVCSLLARDRGGPAPCFQLLLYPVTDMAAESPSFTRFAEGYFLTREMARFFHHTYLAGADASDWRASPLRRDDLAGLPPALVQLAPFDVLHDEGHAYAERLRAAGVAVRTRVPDGLIHGFAQMGGVVPAADRAVAEAAAALADALADHASVRAS